MQKKRIVEISEQEAFAKLSALCARAEHSSGEMLQKMRDWYIDQSAQERVLARLQDMGFIDDERYARAYIADKMRYNQWGRRKIAQGLWQKGVDRTVYDPLLREIERDEFIAILRPLLEAKRRTVRAESPYEQRMKLVRFAVGRGFDLDEIEACLGYTDDAYGLDDD